MKADLWLTGGAPIVLPVGDRPWIVRHGNVEVYLVSPDSRRLVAVVDAGRHVFPFSAETDLHLSLVAPEGAHLVAVEGGEDLKESAIAWLSGHKGEGLPDEHLLLPAAGEAESISSFVSRFTLALTERHAESDAKRNAAALARLATRETDNLRSRTGGNLNAVLRTIGEEIGVVVAHPPRHNNRSADFNAVARLARLAGFRARRLVLPAGWWRHNLGPLIVRHADGSEVEALLWRRGAYRRTDGGEVGQRDVDTYDAIAFTAYQPLPSKAIGFAALGRHAMTGIRRNLGLILAAGSLAAVIGLAVPLLTAWIFRDIVPDGSAGLLAAVGIALIVAALTQSVLRVAQALAVARINGRTSVQLSAGLNDRVLQLSPYFFKTMAAGDLNQRLQSIEALRSLAVEVVLSSAVTALFSIIYLVLLFVFDAWLALVAIGGALVYAAALLLSRLGQVGALREGAELDGRLAGLTYEILEGIAKLRSAAAEWRVLARWRTLYRREQAANARAARASNHFGAFADAWQTMTLAGIFVFAGFLASTDLSASTFIGFLTAFGIFQGSTVVFCDALLRMLVAQPLAERARPILAAEPEAAVGLADPGRLEGRIEANGVSFHYDEGRPLIADLDFALSPGGHMAIVGGSGAGKSTIFRLLLGFEKPRTGVILYDGQDLSGLDPARVREQIGVVLQSSSLFAGSILDNIRGAADLSLEECLDAADRAGLSEELDLFPMGMHTLIAEGAGTLSGGQRQRILIARAIACRPRILFLDEATSALDNGVQAIISETIDTMQVTRITIAHRLSTVRTADRICVLKDGRFVEAGRYEDLIAKRGHFANLAQRQLMGD